MRSWIVHFIQNPGLTVACAIGLFIFFATWGAIENHRHPEKIKPRQHPESDAKP